MEGAGNGTRENRGETYLRWNSKLGFEVPWLPWSSRGRNYEVFYWAVVTVDGGMYRQGLGTVCRKYKKSPGNASWLLARQLKFSPVRFWKPKRNLPSSKHCPSFQTTDFVWNSNVLLVCDWGQWVSKTRIATPININGTNVRLHTKIYKPQLLTQL